MKLKDILAKVDPEKIEYESWGSVIHTLSEELQIDLWGVDKTDKDCEFKMFWLARHCCTDTWVGVRAYYWKNELIAVTTQDARKSCEIFNWISFDKAVEVKTYLQSLGSEEDTETFDILDMEQEIIETYHVEYAGEFIDLEVLYKGEPVTIVSQPHTLNGVRNLHSVQIEHESGELEWVYSRELQTPWRTTEGEQ